MKKLQLIWGIVFLFILGLIFSCEPLRSYPETPEISFKSISFEKTSDDLGNEVTRVELTFHLIDGDGDVGLASDDTIAFPDPNLYVFLLQKTGDDFNSTNPLFNWEYRTPYYESQGQDKSLVADFNISMDFTKGSLPANDTIKFSYYIFDRKLHKSNVDETPEIPSDTIGTITRK